MMTTTFYKLSHLTNHLNLCYVGSTSDYAHRMSSHKWNCNNKNSKKYDNTVYKYIRAHGGFNNWHFTILDHREKMRKLPRMLKERSFIEEHDAQLNDNNPGAVLEVGIRQYKKNKNREQQLTINTCEKCNMLYKGKANKSNHQNTQQCNNLYALRVARETREANCDFGDEVWDD